MKNPHLRAKLAEVLEAVMPHLDQAQNPLVSSVFHRKRVFCSYQHAAHLAEALIKVFVDIEFTGKRGTEELCSLCSTCWGTVHLKGSLACAQVTRTSLNRSSTTAVPCIPS